MVMEKVYTAVSLRRRRMVAETISDMFCVGRKKFIDRFGIAWCLSSNSAVLVEALKLEPFHGCVSVLWIVILFASP